MKEVVKSCETKISKLNLELNKADQSLKDTEAFYEKDETLQQHFQDKISSIKSKKDKLEEEIFENKARITQMNNFNDEVLKILKQLDDDVKEYVREVAAFREEITKEKKELLKEIANKDQDLAKEKDKRLKTEKENESLKSQLDQKEEQSAQLEKEKAELLIQVELLKKNQQSPKDVVLLNRSTKLENSYDFLSLNIQTKETLKNKSEVETKTQITEKDLETKKDFVNKSESGLLYTTLIDFKS